MKEKNYSPYGTFGLDKINAPKSDKKSEPKATKTTTNGDLRCKEKK